MKKLNWSLWLGFLLSILAFISYPFFFAKFPVTRDFPWANFLLFGIAAALLFVGLRGAFSGSQPLRGKIVTTILTVLSVFVFGGFCFIIFYASRHLPASAGSPRIGQRAPEFALRDTQGELVSLSALLSSPMDKPGPSSSAPKGVLLIFYRGYW